MDAGDLVKLAIPAVALSCAIAALLYALSPAKVFLERKRKRAQIMDVVQLSHDTKRIRLSLGGKSTTLGLPTGKHLSIYAPNPESSQTKGTWNGKEDKESKQAEIERKYTPVTGNETPGYVDLVIKVYRPGKVKMPDGREMSWEDGGKMSLYLDAKKPGDYLEINGPLGVNEYLGNGTFKLPGRTLTVSHVGMMAGGTGLTPMLQVAQAALRDPKDRTVFSLVYANKTEEDILCREQLDEAVRTSNGRFKVHYTLDFPPANWQHKTGFITEAMIKECLPGVELNPVILMCGPPPMIEFACKRNLLALGYDKTRLVPF